MIKIFKIILSVFVILICIGWYFISGKTKPLVNQTSLSSPTIIPTLAPTSIHSGYVSVNLPVTLLSTSYYYDFSEPTYTPNSTVSVPSSLKSSLGAYWLAGGIVLGPKHWTGEAKVGGDGTTATKLHPIENKVSGESIIIENYPACASCIFYGAAPFFPAAKLEYEQGFGPFTESNPTGMKIINLSTSLVKFTIPINQKGLVTNGIAYYRGLNDKINPPGFIRIDITLPTNQSELSNFLLNNFIEQKKLR